METPGLEQGCVHHTKNAIGNDLSDFDRQESISLRSIAMSLKRIANALEASNVKLDIIGNSVSRGFFELKESVEDK